MKHYLVKKSKLKGEISIPPSKSQTLRAILFGALAMGETHLRNPLHSTDTQSMIEACRLLGAKIDVTEECLKICGIGGEIGAAEDVIYAGNSGIVLRFIAAIGALSKHPIVITGDHSIRHQREMQPLLEALNQLGVRAKSMRGDGFAPVIIEGPMQSGACVIKGHDSQPVSALLIAASLANGLTEIQVENPGEKPWISLTLEWFDRLGIHYEREGYTAYRIPGKSCIEGFTYAVPGDFSSAAFPLAAALVTDSELTLHNLDMRDAQGDKELISVLQQMGAKIEIDAGNNAVSVKKGGRLEGVSVDVNNFIDAIPILAVVGCYAEGKTHIRNGAVARTKECNRIGCITNELQKMGANICETEDGVIVRKSVLQGGSVHSHNDHRMAMALAVAGLGALEKTQISPIACVSKTYPKFCTQMIDIGANIEERA